MNCAKMHLTQSDMLDTRARHKLHISDTSARLIKYYSDPDKKVRLGKHLCKYCFYFNTSRIGGSAITSVICANCDSEITFGNTCVDVVCDKCAESLKICKHCGQRMD